MYRTLLVPLDGSKRAEAILVHVEQMAKQNRAKVILLKVEDEPMMLDRDEVIDIERYSAQLEKQRERDIAYLTDVQGHLNLEDISTEIRLTRGAVVKSILKIARDTGADLIAMATHGWSGLTRVSYGSVAAGVLQAAELPLLLIRSGENRLEQ
jgi:nucleotide-binding universal stress UspA family protein